MGSTTTPNGHPDRDVPRIPIVDFTPWIHSTDKASRLTVAKELVKASREIGFVYITNHSVSDDLLDEAFEWSRRFFALSTEDKLKAPHPEGWAIHRGYSWPGLEKVSDALSEGNDAEKIKKLREIADFKESYDMGSDNNSDQPNQWIPEEILPGFHDFMMRFYWECFKAASDILRALALGIGLEDENHILKLHSGNNNQLRLLHYPPIPAAAVESQTMARMPAHCDWSSITMLFQDDCGGLEVEDPKNPDNFIPATPVKNAIVMNVGDLLQMWSNDYLRSTKHRVGLPPAELSNRFQGPQRTTRERYSIPYFLAPDPDLLIECLPACMSEQNPAKYEPITQRNYNRMRASMQY